MLRLALTLIIAGSLLPIAARVACASVLTDRESAFLIDKPALRNVLESGRDLWGEQAMKQPNGPSYDFFAGLLPPLRYCNAEFRQYPIVLSAPGAPVKARLVSNGSAVNARAGLKTWREVGMPISFGIGSLTMPPGQLTNHYVDDFGKVATDLDGPHYANGYLPIVRLSYAIEDVVISEEAFASVDKNLASHGTVFVRFSPIKSGPGYVSVMVGQDEQVSVSNGFVVDAQGSALVGYGPVWKWDSEGHILHAVLPQGSAASLAIFTQPIAPTAAVALTPGTYERERAACVSTWQALLDRAMQVDVPEPVVNNAWRSLIVGNFMLLKGDDMCYSNGNQYEKLYVNEGGDAIRSLLLWGYAEDCGRMIVPIMDYKREGLLFHQAGLKLQMLSSYYHLTHDARFFEQQRDRWMLQVNRIIEGREPGSGLFPKEQYCGDIATPVYSLNSNSNAWRGIRDFGAVLDEIGEKEQAKRCADTAKAFRPVILSAVEKSVRRDVEPPFVPIALFGEEQPYEATTATRMGGYYDLMAPLVLGSGVLGAESQLTTDMLDYFHQRGGICMGMVRVHPAGDMYRVKQGVDDLYSLRYVLTLLQRDEVDRALVSLYGKLAQGFTRETFIDGESSALVPDDRLGRAMYLPPNSAANGFFLTMLRYLMVQDWDLNDDGSPDTLRLMFATPKRWLEDGKSISIERAPTAFGQVSVAMHSHLNSGSIVAEVTAPPKAPGKMLLRARVPDGWKVLSARAGAKALPVDRTGAVDVTSLRGKFEVKFKVAAQKQRRLSANAPGA
jgi:hypothetical protein